ncbi:RING-H2 finger protein ATL68 [Capsicum annuum]|uniref:RING-H2 finger protein ATL67 n=1 Tax=Capsicum annuum TaxID=4072 RepID=UPI0007BEC7F5|nr:RING-H2 finger protein ATL67 [Capsicum annuum]KAF3669753.1 RING-H2 finger protein ATL68 [Capsicum annuum]
MTISVFQTTPLNAIAATALIPPTHPFTPPKPLPLPSHGLYHPSLFPFSMSTTSSSLLRRQPPPPPPITYPPPISNYSLSQNLSTIGLGYAIAIALGFLVLLSTVLLASYICCRSAAARRRRRQLRANSRNPNSNHNNAENGIYLPRIIFVAEDDEENDEGLSQNATLGLDQVVINSYPKLVYSKRNGNGSGNDVVCPICLCEYRDGEMLRMMPDCKHYFHVMCLDAWLKLNASCPVCRNSPLPTPLSTPLSEVVPLSQYSDGRRRL